MSQNTPSSESPTHPDAPRAGGETPDTRTALDLEATLSSLTIALEAHQRDCGEYGVDTSDDMQYALELVAEARAALPALLDRPAPSDGWQPATTAPRSGEHILITQLGRAGFGYTDGVAQDWCAVAHYWPVAGEEGFYLSAGASSEIDDHPLSFTHWMPLPVVCLCDYSLANAPGVTHQPHCPLSSRAALLERHRDGEREIAGYALVRNDGVIERMEATRDYLDKLAAKCNEAELRAAPYRVEPLYSSAPRSTAGPSPERASK